MCKTRTGRFCASRVLVENNTEKRITLAWGGGLTSHTLGFYLKQGKRA